MHAFNPSVEGFDALVVQPSPRMGVKSRVDFPLRSDLGIAKKMRIQNRHAPVGHPVLLDSGGPG